MNYNPNKPMTLDDVLKDPALHQGLVQLAQKRYWASQDYSQPWFEKWVRYYKIYRAIVDAVENSDEPNFMIAYAYGIIEDLVSRIAEPILQMKPPCRVQAKMAGHEQQADNFSSIASNYFQTSRYQYEKTEGVRELCIIGNSWEQDQWLNDYAEGKLWAKVPRQTIMDKVMSLTGKIFNTQTAVPYESVEEVPYQYPISVGYRTRFPWAFNIFPEPGKKHVRDMHWLIEQERAVAVEDLARKTYTDPKTGKQKALFDFTQLLKDTGPHTPGSIVPIPIELRGHDYGKEAQDAMAGKETERTQWTLLDIDHVSLLWVWEQNRMYAVANGKYVVAYKENVFQVPRIPWRLGVYTPQKEFLFGTGALEPIESQLYELNDIHKLSMRNWVRIINRMVAYNEESVPYKDDFLPRAGGRIRVRPGPGGSVGNEIVSLHQEDVTQSMLAQESNTKGLIERTISLADFSPGVDGTKQTHKTLGGLMEISRNVAQRVTTVRRMLLTNYQDQMWFMEKLYSQFQLDKQPFSIYGPDGSTRLSQFDLWDIHTGGVGFDFVIEYDPSFGDDALLRNQMMVLLDTSIKYENARIQLGDSKMAKANLEDIMRRIFRAFGWADTSQMLMNPDGLLDPMNEFNLMVDGQPVAPNPKENLVQHLIEHYIQKSSPKLLKGIADGSIDPKVMALLKAHIQATEIRIATVLQNPQQIAQAQMMEAMRNSQMGNRNPMPGAAGGNPQAQTPNLTSGAPVAGVPVLNNVTPTPRNSGMPQGI